jgi:DNA-3-methyladenine glycosylase II
MGLTADRIRDEAEALGRKEARFAALVDRHGLPQPRIRPRGFETLLRAIVSQQVSTAAASSIWARLEALLGTTPTPEALSTAPPEALRAAGLSRQKIGYAQSLATLVRQGELPLEALPADDEAAIALLTAVRGLGRWSAEIYLLFAEGRADAFPAGDLAVQVQAGRLFHAGVRPSERLLREHAEAWRPHRGVAALLLWHGYNAPPL